MATTAFSGIGLGQLGSEQSYMHGSNPINEAFKAVQDFAMLAAIDKSGLAGWLNTLGQKKDELQNKFKTPPVGAVAPTSTPTVGINPQAAASWNTMPQAMPSMQANQPMTATQPFGGAAFNNAMQQQQRSIEDMADEAMGIKKPGTGNF
jgi:hypothetical protein